MKEFIESLSAADLKKVAKKFGIDNTQPRIGIVTKLVEYTELNATTKEDIESLLVKKPKLVTDENVSPVEEDITPEQEAIGETEEKLVQSLPEEAVQEMLQEEHQNPAQEVVEEAILKKDEPSTINEEIEDKLEEVIDELKEAYEDVVGDAKEVLSATAHKWYKYLEYMKGKKSWEDFFRYLDSKAQNQFKFKEQIQEIKNFLNIK